MVPESINTDRLQDNVCVQAEALGISFETRWQDRGGAVPWGRFGEPDEFGRAGAFLLSEAASYITGEMLVVVGGAMKTVW